jgi:DNA ligase (NAD+)
MQAIQSASFEDLMAVKEIGERIAESIGKYFTDEKNREVLGKLEIAGLQMQLQKVIRSGTALEGKSLIVSGVFTQYSRDEIKALIEQHGGKNVSSISTRTNYLVAGENMGPSKLTKAMELNIPVISEEEFLLMIGVVK